MSKHSRSRKQRKKSAPGRKSARKTRSASPSGASDIGVEPPQAALLGRGPTAVPRASPERREKTLPKDPPPPALPARPVISRKSPQKPRPAPATPAHELMRVQTAPGDWPLIPPSPPKPLPAPGNGDKFTLTQIYETLAALLVPYARKMESEMHPKIGFCLKAKSARTGRETHFGAVQALPDGVAYHLFPLYSHPDLLEHVTPELFNRMRSKTCFHFDELDAGIVAELAQLTHEGFERFLADGVLQ